MTQYILDTFFNINGCKIKCKVTGDPGSANDGLPFLLEIPGGPGEAMGTMITDFFYSKTMPAYYPRPHIITFDFPGCGASEVGQNPDAEYTIDNFTEVAAKVAEAVTQQLKLNKMDLHLIGGSVGGTFALNLPLHRPGWTQPDSKIKLKGILVYQAPIGIHGTLSPDFVRAVFAKEKELPNYLKALDKLHSGKINSRHAYICDYVVPMSGAYSEEYKSHRYKFFSYFLKHHPDFTVKLLKSFHINSLVTLLDTFSYEVLNQFFATQWHGYELKNAMQNFKNKPGNNYRNIYANIPILGIYNSEDMCTSGAEHLYQLQQLIPTACTILVPGKHHEYRIGALLEYFMSGRLDQLTGEIYRQKFENKILNAHIPRAFEENYTAAFLPDNYLDSNRFFKYMIDFNSATKKEITNGPVSI